MRRCSVATLDAVAATARDLLGLTTRDLYASGDELRLSLRAGGTLFKLLDGPRSARDRFLLSIERLDPAF